MTDKYCRMASKVHLNINLVADKIQLDLPVAVDLDAAQERIHCESSVEMMTRIVLEAVVVAVAGSLSNFDFLEFMKNKKKKFLDT